MRVHQTLYAALVGLYQGARQPVPRDLKSRINRATKPVAAAVVCPILCATSDIVSTSF